MVDYIMQETFGEIDVEKDPIIVPLCGHMMTLSSMDGHMGMSSYYQLSETSSIVAVRPLPEAFSADEAKTCPMCRGPLRDINRYNRIVRQKLIEAGTKRFITWANQRYVPLEKELYAEEGRLQDTGDEWASVTPEATRARTSYLALAMMTGQLDSTGLMKALRAYPELRERYRRASALQGEISEFLRLVSEEEQPFGRVFDMMQDVRRRRGVRSGLGMDRSVLNTRNRTLATVLKIRCDIAIVNDYFLLRRKSMESGTPRQWSTADLDVDFSGDRQACDDLLVEARARDQPMHQVEASVFWARWAILERSVRFGDVDKSEALLASAQEQLERAEKACEDHPGQTRGMPAEIEEARRMLRGSVFYTRVDNEEKRQVYAAMANEFSGTGHWYTCVNGHPFTVADCGMPMETSRCPQCGEVVGGQSHRPAEGVRHAREFDDEFGAMALRER
ncbi:MAG: hypothetical protein M1832_003353 [Thelocarpon impressellum]|nr:MAG: hypothetical protein M1832_003353 [Thelocarpon impressellum]